MPELNRPILALVGHIVDDGDPELRSLDLAARFFERKVGQRGAKEDDIANALVWLIGTRVELHNAKGAIHTIGHLRARSRGRFREAELLASFLEVRLFYEIRDYVQGLKHLDRLQIREEDERLAARLKALRQQYRARFQAASGQVKVALEEYGRALQALRVGPAQLEDLAITADILNDNGDALHQDSRLDDALDAYIKAETVAKHINFPLAQARSLQGRGNVMSSRKEIEEGIRFLRSALDIYQSFDSPYGILKTCISLGRAYYAANDFRQALFYFEEARVQCGKGKYPIEEAEVNARIGDILLTEGQYEKAAEFYEHELQIVSIQGSERNRANALRNVGRIQRLLGNFMRAEACLDESRLLFERLQDRSGLCLTLQQMVQCYLEEGKTAQARGSLETLKQAADRLGRSHEIGLARMLEGIVLRHEGRAGDARTQLERSLQVLAREPGFFTVMCRLELAQAMEELGERESAIHQFKEAIQMSRKLKLHDLEKRSLDSLARADRSEWARMLHGGGAAAAAQRRRASRVFLSVAACELRGSEALWSYDPEEAAVLLNHYFETMTVIIQQQGGVLGRITGDRLIMVFGLESTCDPARALQCAQMCLEAFGRLRQENPRYQALGIAGAVATGQSIEGMLGPTDRLDYTVVGEPISVVQRLLAFADRNEILLCADTYRAVGHNISQATPREIDAPRSEQKIIAYQISASRVLTRPPAR
ncbi:MAG: tetratricopeptide repeat protein [Armatimonadetes bacterium]|nr:tetratricopeptide repeat protein [Armatimonadota bacterium]